MGVLCLTGVDRIKFCLPICKGYITAKEMNCGREAEARQVKGAGAWLSGNLICTRELTD